MADTIRITQRRHGVDYPITLNRAHIMYVRHDNWGHHCYLVDGNITVTTDPFEQDVDAVDVSLALLNHIKMAQMVYKMQYHLSDHNWDVDDQNELDKLIAEYKRLFPQRPLA